MTEIKFVLGITFLLLLLTTFVIVFVFFYQKRFYFLKKEKQELVAKYAQLLLQSKIEIQEQTLQHVGQELHDNLGQVASLIKINLNTLQLEDTAATIEKIESTKGLTRQLIADIKSLSVSLGSDRVKQAGLVKAIEVEVERLNKTRQFIVTCQVGTAIPEIDTDKATILFRMAQEILNNSVKHSKAKHISISINNSNKLFILAFEDDGIGFNAEDNRQNAGAGLRNLSSRANLIEAQLRIQSLPGNGTRATIELLL